MCLWTFDDRMRAIHIAERRCHGEDTTFARRAQYCDVAAHLFGNLFTNNQSKACSAKAPGSRTVGLREGAEELGLLIRCHANTGIGNGYLQPVIAILRRFTADTECNRPIFAKLDGITHEVEQDLAQTHFIADKPLWHALINMQIHRDVFGAGVSAGDLQLAIKERA